MKNIDTDDDDADYQHFRAMKLLLEFHSPCSIVRNAPSFSGTEDHRSVDVAVNLSKRGNGLRSKSAFIMFNVIKTYDNRSMLLSQSLAACSIAGLVFPMGHFTINFFV
jgi:hypothetical protein